MHPLKFLQRGRPQAPAISSAEKAEKLSALGEAIAEKRKEAVDARKASGIEDVWMTCEESYLGIDDANRAEFSGAKWAKPTSMSGPLTSNITKADDTRSTVFVPLTGRYVDGASSKLSEIILPIDDKAFSATATAVPELVLGSKDMSPLMDQTTGQPVTKPADPVGQPPAPMPPPGALPAQVAQGEAAQVAQPPAQVPVTVADHAKAIMDKASAAAEKAETRIYDWLMESKYPFEARKVIKDAARIGAGILKGPVPESINRKAMTKINGAMAMEILQEIKPVVRWVDPWNFYPADGCGENIHDGDYCLEKDYLSGRKLKALKKQSNYLADQIDIVLEQGPGKVYLDSSNHSDKRNKNRYEVWYYYGSMSKEDMQLVGAVGVEDEADKDEFYAIVTLINETVIRAVINPLDSGRFPYNVMPWRRRPGMWAGVGVAEQMAVPQRMVNAATRAMLNNAGLSSGPQIIIDQMGIVPADNSNRLYPGKIWYKTGESATTDVRQAFLSVMIPSVENEMMAIIQYAMKLAEEATSIPLIAQGQQGPTSPQTFGQAELQNNNSLTWLRDIGYSYDGHITAPMVDSLYEWLLLDPSVPDDAKGDFTINANGSAAMVERAIQEQTMMSLLQVAQNPAFDIDPAKLFAEYLRSKRLDPRRIQLSPEDKAKRDAQQPPPPVQVQVETLKGQNTMQAIAAKGQVDGSMAQLEAQQELQLAQQTLGHEQQMLQSGGASAHQATALSRMEVAKINAASRERSEQIKTERDIAYVTKEQEMSAQNLEARHQERRDMIQLEMLKYANQNQQSLDQIKADLSKTSMQESTKRQLAQAEIALNQSENQHDRLLDTHKHHTKLIADQSVIEPAGRAEPGKAFSQ